MIIRKSRAEIEQMAGDLAGTIAIIMINRITIFFSGLVIDHRYRNAVLLQLVAVLIVEWRRADQDAIHAAFAHRIDDRLFADWITVGGSDE